MTSPFENANEQTVRKRVYYGAALTALCAAIAFTPNAKGQVLNSAVDDQHWLNETSSTPVIFEPNFFVVFRPVTALEMVQRLPGFQIDEGSDVRGFGANAGNVLINGERPTTKTTTLNDVLRRIPAERVSRIELIRGSTGALEARTQGVVANIVLAEESQQAGSVSWQVIADYSPDRLTPRGEVAYTRQIGATEFTFATERFETRDRSEGPEAFNDLSGVAEDRNEVYNFSFGQWSGALVTETQFQNDRILRTNFRLADEDLASSDVSVRTTSADIQLSLFEQRFDQDEWQFEGSADFETPLTETLGAKFAVLYNREESDAASRLRVARPSGASRSVFAFKEEREESIARAEFDWSRWQKHQLSFGIEGVFNALDSDASFTINGFEVPIDGANTRVTETRGEAFFVNVWRPRETTTIDAGFAVETSTIRQTGDFENERDFVYAKPSLAITQDLPSQLQLRVRVEREVGQLDFGDFVSATNFGDQDIDFGNPDLQPERTWTVESTIEKRLGQSGVISARVFHDWIDDVEDLLPIGGVFEVPGNIGDGRRWGGDLDLEFTLDWIGLSNTRVEARGSVQDSVVTDPVTGLDRELSNETSWSYRVNLRQDLEQAQFAWGVGLLESSDQIAFGVDEQVRTQSDANLTAFVETTRIAGIRIELSFDNLLDRDSTRERTVFSGARSLSPVAFTEIRERRRGRSASLTLRGAF